jgi:uncharacterized membrane protein YhaH (DUF805 family)
MNLLAMLMLQESGDQAAGGAAATVMIVAYLAIVVLMIAAMWKVFQKAGEPGWAAIVPIYNLVVLMRIAGKPGWWVLLMFIPVVNLVVAILAIVGVAKNFGKGTGYALGLLFLSPIFYPMLAWGDARYQKTA